MKTFRSFITTSMKSKLRYLFVEFASYKQATSFLVYASYRKLNLRHATQPASIFSITFILFINSHPYAKFAQGS